MIAKLLSRTQKFSGDASGATAIEYGLIAAGIAVVIIGGLALAGGQLTNPVCNDCRGARGLVPPDRLPETAF